MKAYLNGTFYNMIDAKYQNLIEDSVWYVGGHSTSSVTAKGMYEAEMGNNPTRDMCMEPMKMHGQHMYRITLKIVFQIIVGYLMNLKNGL